MQNTMTHHGYIGSLELDGQKGVLFGRVLGIREKIAYTAQDAAGIATAFRKAVDQYIHACERAGKKPEESFKGMFNIRIPPDLHRRLALYAVHHKTNLNRLIVQILSSYEPLFAEDENGAMMDAASRERE